MKEIVLMMSINKESNIIKIYGLIDRRVYLSERVVKEWFKKVEILPNEKNILLYKSYELKRPVKEIFGEVLKDFLINLNSLKKCFYKGIYIFQIDLLSTPRYLHLNKIDINGYRIKNYFALEREGIKPRYAINYTDLGINLYILEQILNPSISTYLKEKIVKSEGLLYKYEFYKYENNIVKIDNLKLDLLEQLELNYLLYFYETILGQEKAIAIISTKESDKIILKNNFNKSSTLHSYDLYKEQLGLAFIRRLWLNWFKKIYKTHEFRLNLAWFIYFLKQTNRVGYSEVYFNSIQTNELNNKELIMDSKKVSNINYYDYNSMYGSLLQSGPFPLGIPGSIGLEYISSNNINDYTGLVFVKIEHNINLLNSLIKDLGKTNVLDLRPNDIALIKKTHPGFYVPYINTGEINIPYSEMSELNDVYITKSISRQYHLIKTPVYIWLTHEELKYCLTIDYLITPLYGLNFINGYGNYTRGITTYILSLLKEYNQQDFADYYKNITNEIIYDELLTNTDITWPYFTNQNPISKGLLKLGLNALIGTFAQLPYWYRKNYLYATTPKGLYSPNNLLLDIEREPQQTKNLFVNTFIISRGRIKLHTEICNILRSGHDILYCATDSIITTQTLKTSSNIGTLKLESGNIKCFYSLNVGVYFLVNDKDFIKYKYQGISDKSNLKQFTTYLANHQHYFTMNKSIFKQDLIINFGPTGRIVYCNNNYTVLESFPRILEYKENHCNSLLRFITQYNPLSICIPSFTRITNNPLLNNESLISTQSSLDLEETKLLLLINSSLEHDKTIHINTKILNSIISREQDFKAYVKIYTNDSLGVEYMFNEDVKLSDISPS